MLTFFGIFVLYCCVCWLGWGIMLSLSPDGGYFGAWVLLPFVPFLIPYLIFKRIFGY